MEMNAVVSPEFEQWLHEVRALRASYAQSEGAFFLTLRKGELDGLWKKGGYDSFARVLTKFNLTTPARYESFKVLLAHVGEEHIRENGFEASKPLLAVPSHVESRRRPGVSALEGAMSDINEARLKNGVPVSQWQQRVHASHHYVPQEKKLEPRTPAEPKMDTFLASEPGAEEPTYSNRVEELEAKLAEKEEEISFLQGEIKKRDDRIAVLEAKLNAKN